jgi:hypothetical protein
MSPDANPPAKRSYINLFFISFILVFFVVVAKRENIEETKLVP